MVAAGLLTVSLLALAACTPALSPDQAAVRATIERYDALLAQGYRAMDMNPLQEVATLPQAQTEYIHMSSLAEGGVRLLPTLKSITYKTISVEGTGALAETVETWDYTHQSRATGKTVLVQKGLVYDLSWTLERHTNGAWFVSAVRAIDSTSSTAPQQVGTVTPTPAVKAP